MLDRSFAVFDIQATDNILAIHESGDQVIWRQGNAMESLSGAVYRRVASSCCSLGS
jgi:hypothetical protein